MPSGLSLVILAVLSLTVGRTGFTRRTVLGLACGMAVFWSGQLLAVLGVQRGLDAGAVPSVPVPDLALTLVVVAAVVAGVLAGALAGADPDLPATEPVTGARAPLAADERAVWIRTVGPSRTLLRWGGLAAAVYLGLTAWLAVVAGSWSVAVTLLIVLPLMIATAVWQVRVDATGLTVRGSVGWPRQHVPAREVVGASVRQVSPFRDFGGWGLRVALTFDGTHGVVVRAGEAIAVERTGGRTFVVTVDDAATGAALLNTFAERTREPGAPADES